MLRRGRWPRTGGVDGRLLVIRTRGSSRLGDSTYIHKSVFGFSPVVIALGLGTMAGNAARKSRAAREGAPQWRWIGDGVLYMTSRRLVIQEAQTWHMVWYQDVMSASCDRTAINVQCVDMPGLLLSLPNADYYFVMLYRLAFNQLVRPPG